MIGDGTQAPHTVAGDRLYDNDIASWEDRLQSVNQTLSKPVKETKDSLSQKIYELYESGPTALGPAVLTSIVMASSHGQGSQVIVCTDGLANVGVGSLED